MGMFEKDKVFGGKRLVGDDSAEFKFGDEFILWDGVIAAENVEFDNDIGKPATKTVLTVSRLESPNEKFDVGTFASAIAEKVKEKEEGDLPAVVQVLQVPTDMNDATVIQFVRPWDGSTPLDDAKPEPAAS